MLKLRHLLAGILLTASGSLLADTSQVTFHNTTEYDTFKIIAVYSKQSAEWVTTERELHGLVAKVKTHPTLTQEVVLGTVNAKGTTTVTVPGSYAKDPSYRLSRIRLDSDSGASCNNVPTSGTHEITRMFNTRTGQVTYRVK